MSKKFLSLIVIPHTKTSSRTLSFSKKTVKTALYGGIVLAVLLLGMSADYIRIQLSHQSYSALKAENLKQKAELEKYQTQFASLQNNLGKFDEYVGKINMMFGLKSPDKMSSPGAVGGGSGDQTLPAGPAQLSLGGVQNLQLKAEDVQKNFDTVIKMSQELTSLLASRPSIWPTNGWPSSGVGMRDDPFTGKRTFHSGLDIAAAYGNPVVAPADGYVISAAWDKYFGNCIRINHGGGLITLFGHLSKSEVKAGQKVKRGDEIGLVGNTGRSLGTHLHYEVRENDKILNPMNFILD
jgi:murein DD-endopeptidase MepM/ murein hydrolase activator NlpD